MLVSLFRVTSAARRATGVVSDNMLTMSDNPYRPGQGLTPPYLADRQREITSMRAALGDRFPQNIAVYGLRGVGKTVLSHAFRQVAAEQQWVSVRREFAPRFLAEAVFAPALLLDLQTCLEEISVVAAVKGSVKRAWGVAQEVIGGLRVKYEGFELSYQAGAKTPVGRALEDDLLAALRRVSDVAHKSGRGVVLLYDEFQELRDRPTDGEFPLSAFISSAAAVQQEGLPIMLVLSGLPPLIEHLASAKSYTERMFEGQEIGALRESEGRRALVEPARKADRDYEPAAVDAILEETGRYPYFIQFYGRELWDAASSSTIDVRAFKRSRGEIQHKLDTYFYRARYTRATPAQRQLLREIARIGETATIQQLLETTGKKHNAVQMLIRGLIDSGLVYRPDRGQIAFSAPMFGKFVLRQED